MTPRYKLGLVCVCAGVYLLTWAVFQIALLFA